MKKNFFKKKFKKNEIYNFQFRESKSENIHCKSIQKIIVNNKNKQIQRKSIVELQKKLNKIENIYVDELICIFINLETI